MKTALAIAAEVHAMRGLPQPAGLSINRRGELWIVVRDREDFDPWADALAEIVDSATVGGRRHVIGWLQTRQFGCRSERIRTTISDREEG